VPFAFLELAVEKVIDLVALSGDFVVDALEGSQFNWIALLGAEVDRKGPA